MGFATRMLGCRGFGRVGKGHVEAPSEIPHVERSDPSGLAPPSMHGHQATVARDRVGGTERMFQAPARTPGISEFHFLELGGLAVAQLCSVKAVPAAREGGTDDRIVHITPKAVQVHLHFLPAPLMADRPGDVRSAATCIVGEEQQTVTRDMYACPGPGTRAYGVRHGGIAHRRMGQVQLQADAGAAALGRCDVGTDQEG